MEQVNYTTKTKKFKHLDYKKRLQIEALFKAGKKANEISKIIGCSKRTIEREFKRGRVKQRQAKYDFYRDIIGYSEYMVYSADVAQYDYEIQSTAKGAPLKIEKDFELVKFIEECIGKQRLSPYSTAQKIKLHGFKTTLHWKTIYNYLDRDLFLNISNKDLWEKSHKRKRKYRKTRIAYNNTKGTPITERPREAESRQEIGHWEMDTVESGKGYKAALLVLTERVSRTEEIYKLDSKTQEAVRKTLDKIEKKIGARAFRKRYKTITCDNGSEFLAMDTLERSAISKKKKRTKIYYCHPYSAWERGSNENANKMIRRFIPKGANIANYSEEAIQQIQDYMNNCPRRILGGYPPNRVLKTITA
jgi:IS30 family transposase